MKFINGRIGKQILEDGTVLYIPYIKDTDGDIVPYEPHYTIGEAMQWILDQTPFLQLKVLNKVAERMQDPQMRLEAYKFIAGLDMVNKEIAEGIVKIAELDTKMVTTLTIYPHRADVVVRGVFYDKVCGIFGDSWQSNRILTNYKYQIIEGFNSGGYRLKSYQQRVGSYLHYGCHEPINGDLNMHTIIKYFREHHMIG